MQLRDVLALETEVWQALVDGDADADARLLSADFVGVYPDGFSSRDGASVVKGAERYGWCLGSERRGNRSPSSEVPGE